MQRLLIGFIWNIKFIVWTQGWGIHFTLNTSYRNHAFDGAENHKNFQSIAALKFL